MPEEVPYNELIEYLHVSDDEPDQFQQNNIQVGFAQIFQPTAEVAFSSWIDPSPVHKPHPQAIRQWVRHFSHQSNSLPSIIIPDSWMNFFTLMLLQSPSFEWAKNFLQSPAWSYFTPSTSGNSTAFCLPKACPDSTLQVYNSSVVIEEFDYDFIVCGRHPRCA